MSKVLTQPNITNTGPEWPNLFVGNPTNGNLGRYGSNGYPVATGTNYNPSGPYPHLYAQADYNATTDPAPAAVTASAYTLPGANNGYFPTFPASYGNGAASEFNNSANQLIHPMFFDLFNPVGDHKLFQLSSHGSLMWAGVNASPSSELVLLSPNNFKAQGPQYYAKPHSSDDGPEHGPRPSRRPPRTSTISIDRGLQLSHIVCPPTTSPFAANSSGVTPPPAFLLFRPDGNCAPARMVSTTRRVRSDDVAVDSGRCPVQVDLQPDAGHLRLQQRQPTARPPAFRDGYFPAASQYYRDGVLVHRRPARPVCHRFSQSRHNARRNTPRFAGWPRYRPTSSISSTPTTP